METRNPEPSRINEYLQASWVPAYAGATGGSNRSSSFPRRRESIFSRVNAARRLLCEPGPPPARGATVVDLSAEALCYITELAGKAAQVDAGSFGAHDVFLVGGGNCGNFGEVARDVFGYRGLFLGRCGDLPVHVADGFYGMGDALEHLPGLGDLLYAFFAAALATFNGLNR